MVDGAIGEGEDVAQLEGFLRIAAVADVGLNVVQYRVGDNKHQGRADGGGIAHLQPQPVGRRVKAEGRYLGTGFGPGGRRLLLRLFPGQLAGGVPQILDAGCGRLRVERNTFFQYQFERLRGHCNAQQQACRQQQGQQEGARAEAARPAEIRHRQGSSPIAMHSFDYSPCPRIPPDGRLAGHWLTRLSIRSLTTAGSARVVVSPRFSSSLAAILRRMRRMILPERVLGRPGAHWIRSGRAMAPISFATRFSSSLRSASEGSMPFIRSEEHTSEFQSQSNLVC